LLTKKVPEMKSYRIALFFLVALTAALLNVGVALAQSGYPQPVDDYVNDFAGALNEPDRQAIHKLFKDLEYQTGIEAVVVTIDSIRDYGTGDASIESFATNLFNNWGMGHKKENNGAMILVAVKDRTCRIELGGGYGDMYDSAMKEIIDTRIAPYFKANDYSRGIYEGAVALRDRITKKVSWLSFYKWHILLVILIVVCVVAGISCMRSGKKGWGWVFFIAAGILLIFLIKMLASGKSSGGFGGGSSFGGGASGSW
jgi:uncharacterized protein